MARKENEVGLGNNRKTSNQLDLMYTKKCIEMEHDIMFDVDFRKSTKNFKSMKKKQSEPTEK